MHYKGGNGGIHSSFTVYLEFKHIGIKSNYRICGLIGFGIFQRNEVQMDALQMELWMHLNCTSRWILRQMDLPWNLDGVLVWMLH